MKYPFTVEIWNSGTGLGYRGEARRGRGRIEVSGFVTSRHLGLRLAATLAPAATDRDGVANPTIITAVVDLEPSRKANTGCCARTCLRCGENFLGKLKVIDRQVTLHRQGQCRARLSWLCPIPECKKRPSGFQFEAALVAVSHSAGISCLLVPYSCLPTPAFHGCS